MQQNQVTWFGNTVSGTNPSLSGFQALWSTNYRNTIFIFCAAAGNTNLTPTCTDDHYGTYTLVAAVPYNSSADTFSVFVRNEKYNYNNNAIYTVNIGAHTSAQCGLVTFIYSGFGILDGYSLIRSIGTTSNCTTTPAATLSNTALTGNATIAAIGYQGGGAITPPTGWSEIMEQNQGGGASLEIATRNSGFTGSTITWGSNPVTAGVVVLELDNTVASVNHDGYSVSTSNSVTYYGALSSGDGEVTAIALAGSEINPIPHYVLACYDTLGNRYKWTDVAISLTNAPTPAGTYIPSTLVILGRR